MIDSVFAKAFRAAPLGSTGALLYGLDHAPGLTLAVLNGLAVDALGRFADQLEQRQHATDLSELMSASGPWRFGPEIAQNVRAVFNKIPGDRPGVALVDPYYFDWSMTYTDDTYGEGGNCLFTYAYRLRPGAVFALNYDPRRDTTPVLVESAILIAFLRGTDLWGNPLLFTAMWQEGLPLGAQCAFGIPRWGTLRRAHDDETRRAVGTLFGMLCRDATETDPLAQLAVDQASARMFGTEQLPTAVERGFPNLSETIWFGAEPFPSLESFEYELIGADLRQRRVSVPVWFRPGRGQLG